MTEFLFDKKVLEMTENVYNFNSKGILFPEVGNDLILRPLSSDDYDKGFLSVLQELTEVGNVTEEQFLNRFHLMKACKGSYYIVVVEDTKKNTIVASATLVIEQKFIHDCSARGRIEDVIVSEDYRKNNLGKILISTLSALSEKLNCYKVTLECKDNLLSFYENFGFQRESDNSNYMQKRFKKSQ